MPPLHPPVKNLGDEQVIQCPACGFDYTHARGTMDLYDSSPGEDRWSFRIPMWCESGHEFDLEVRQHKGQTFVETQNVPGRISPDAPTS
jgi:hypothetical protein